MCSLLKTTKKVGILRHLECKMAHPRGGLSFVLAYNPVDSEPREPVLQNAMYYRLYHRSWFAGCKTYARHVPRRGAPAGCATRSTVRPRGVFLGDLRIEMAFEQPSSTPAEIALGGTRNVEMGVIWVGKS